jgi:dephospho-CoA kinase
VPPQFVGLTGGIAAGKSEALAAFGRLGAAVLSTDAVVHELLDEPEVRARLVKRWGEEVVADGGIDRGRVGAIVFERPAELAWLEAVLHPLVGERVTRWRQSLTDDTRLAVVEVPLLFETGMESAFDATVCVVAPDPTRSARSSERGTALLERRDGRQLSQEEKAELATYVIENNGSLPELEARIARLLPQLVAAAEDSE